MGHHLFFHQYATFDKTLRHVTGNVTAANAADLQLEFGFEIENGDCVLFFE